VPGSSGGFFPPVGYAWFWPAAGVLLLLLAGAWLGFVFWWTRKLRIAPGEAPTPLPPRRLPPVRSKYSALIDEIAHRHRRGDIDAREANQRLSAAVRGFTREVTGVASDRMTLSELQAIGFPPVVDAVEFFYPVEFGLQSAREVEHSVSLAHQVVRAWP
jgi:hypothetical protein